VPHGSSTKAPAIVALGVRADPLLSGQTPPYSLVEPLERADSGDLIRTCGWCEEIVASVPCPSCGFSPRAQTASAG
jgi:hypothetical protein